MVARHVALLLLVLDANCCLASLQHIRGDLNTVADLLSFLGRITSAGEKKHPIAFNDPLNNILAQRFHLSYPEQRPENFDICQLPKEIYSWVLSILRTAASCLILAEEKAATSHVTMTGPGDAGSDFVPKLDEAMTLFSLSYSQSDKNSSYVPSLLAFEEPRNRRREAEKLKESIRSQWPRALCTKPQATWLQCFGTISNQSPCTSRAQPSCALPPAPSSKPLKMPTQPQNDNGSSPPNCCERCIPYSRSGFSQDS